MKHTQVIGADPGLSGALALFTPATGDLVVVDMPVLVLKKGKGTKRYIDYASLARLVDSWCPPDQGYVRPVAFVEQVSSRPGEGVASAFDFGRSYGALKMVFPANYLRVVDVTPQVWKRAVGIPVGAGKDQSRAAAMNFFPKDSGLFARAKDDGRAEAALIAYYGATWLGVTSELERA